MLVAPSEAVAFGWGLVISSPSLAHEIDVGRPLAPPVVWAASVRYLALLSGPEWRLSQPWIVASASSSESLSFLIFRNTPSAWNVR